MAEPRGIRIMKKLKGNPCDDSMMNNLLAHVAKKHVTVIFSPPDGGFLGLEKSTENLVCRAVRSWDWNQSNFKGEWNGKEIEFVVDYIEDDEGGSKKYLLVIFVKTC